MRWGKRPLILQHPKAQPVGCVLPSSSPESLGHQAGFHQVPTAACQPALLGSGPETSAVPPCPRDGISAFVRRDARVSPLTHSLPSRGRTTRVT